MARRTTTGSLQLRVTCRRLHEADFGFRRMHPCATQPSKMEIALSLCTGCTVTTALHQLELAFACKRDIGDFS